MSKSEDVGGYLWMFVELYSVEQASIFTLEKVIVVIVRYVKIGQIVKSDHKSHLTVVKN